MSVHGKRFLLGLLTLALLAGLLAGLLLSFQTGEALWGALAGVGASAASAGLSYALMVQVLESSKLGFLRAHFASMVLRILVLAILGLVVWGPLGWSTRQFLIAVGVSYPFFLLLEAWQLNRRLSDRRDAERAGKT